MIGPMKSYELKQAARGEIRQGGEVLVYDLEAGPVDAKKVHPVVLGRLVANGTAVEKKESSK